MIMLLQWNFDPCIKHAQNIRKVEHKYAKLSKIVIDMAEFSLV